MGARLESTVLLYAEDADFPKLKMFVSHTSTHAFQGSEVSNHNQVCACRPVLKETGHAKCAYNMRTVC